MNENDKREDKFIPMNHSQFNLCVAFALRNGDQKICYCKSVNGSIIGGMASNFQEALKWCRKFYSEDTDADLSIGDFSNGVTIWDKYSILHELGEISEADYEKYLDSIEHDN